MRDGICRDAGHVGICGIGGEDGGYAEICGDMRRYVGICGEDGGYVGICGTDHLPEIGPAGLPFFGPTPPVYKGLETGTANDQRAKKKNAYFQFKLLIINDINQYFNIHLHLIRFIIYNR